MWRSHGSRGGLGSADRVCQAGGSRTRAAGGALSRTSQQGAGALVEASQQGANSALYSNQHAAVAHVHERPGPRHTAIPSPQPCSSGARCEAGARAGRTAQPGQGRGGSAGARRRRPPLCHRSKSPPSSHSSAGNEIGPSRREGRAEVSSARATRRGVTAASGVAWELAAVSRHEEHGEHGEAGARRARPAPHLSPLRPGLRTPQWPRRVLRWHSALHRGPCAGHASWLRDIKRVTESGPRAPAWFPRQRDHTALRRETACVAGDAAGSEQGKTVWKEQLGSRAGGAPLSLGRQAAGGAQEWPAEGVPRQLTPWGPQRSAPAHLTGQGGRFLRPQSSLTTCDAGGPGQFRAPRASFRQAAVGPRPPHTRNGPVATGTHSRS